MHFTIEICYFFKSKYALIFKNTKICSYMAKIGKKAHIYPISGYNYICSIKFY